MDAKEATEFEMTVHARESSKTPFLELLPKSTTSTLLENVLNRLIESGDVHFKDILTRSFLIVTENQIPLSMGLGSSAAFILCLFAVFLVDTEG